MIDSDVTSPRCQISSASRIASVTFSGRRLCANTTIQRPVSLTTAPEIVDAAGEGGLSGPVLRARALEVLVRLRDRVGDRLALIGVGGVTTPEDVRERLSAGADLVQAYTGFIYGGPAWPAAMARAAR